VQRITHETRRITICELHCSLGVTGYVRRLTGGVRVGFWDLDKQFIVIVAALSAVIGGFGHWTMLDDECS
jgi:hypothetical protein